MKRACSNCDFFKETGGGWGECRVVGPEFVGGYYGKWPTIERDDWCGRFVSKNRTATTVVVGQPFIKE